MSGGESTAIPGELVAGWLDSGAIVIFLYVRMPQAGYYVETRSGGGRRSTGGFADRSKVHMEQDRRFENADRKSQSRFISGFTPC